MGTDNGRSRSAIQSDRPEPLVDTHNPVQLLERVAEYYANSFTQNRQAQEYLTSRGLASAELWQAFRVGWVDGTLLDIVPHGSTMHEALSKLGLINAQGEEHFAGCLVVPLTHPDHGVVNFYGRRVLTGGTKHLLLPGPPHGLLNWQAMKSTKMVYLAPSVLDAMALWMAGIGNVTSAFGLRDLPPDLESWLVSFAVNEVRFCFRNDDEGREAAGRLAVPLQRRGIVCKAVELTPAKDANRVLLEEGGHALNRSTAFMRDLPPTADDGVSAAAQVLDKTADGIELCLADVSYQVCPIPPFGSRLRARIRGTRAQRLYVDTVDLYTDRARTIAANKMTSRLGVLKEEAEHHLMTILMQADQWVKERPAAEPLGDGTELVAAKRPEMTEAEREAGLAYLRRPDLVSAILADMESMGYVGEERPKLLAYLLGVSRLIEKPLSGIVMSQSGAGKSGLIEVVELLTPPEEVEYNSRLSPQALSYIPKDFIKRKLVIIEERAGSEAADYTIRILQSKAKWIHSVPVKDPVSGKMKTARYEILGPIAYLETTTNTRINPENASRCFEIYIDESEEQTRRIQEQQRRRRSREGILARQSSEEIRARHHCAQRMLEPLEVAVPYEHLLSFPSRWLRTRRDNERFLSLVEAVAFLHQQQRPQWTAASSKGEVKGIDATLDDYRIAYDLAQGVLGRTLHELTRHAQDLWAELRVWVGERANGGDPSQVHFRRRDLRARLHWPDHRLRDALAELVDMEYVAAVMGSQGKAFQYRLLATQPMTTSPLSQLTTPDELAALLDKEASLAVPV